MALIQMIFGVRIKYSSIVSLATFLVSKIFPIVTCGERLPKIVVSYSYHVLCTVPISKIEVPSNLPIDCNNIS